MREYEEYKGDEEYEEEEECYIGRAFLALLRARSSVG
jgi:hypothetical protein